jgi:secreted Zn-dependent insulinase-like peptidase
MTATFEKEYASKPHMKTKIYEAEFLKYNRKESFLYNINRPVNNSANLNVFYYPLKDPEIRAAFRVFSSWLSPEFFAELRTKKQLGYVASAQLRLFNDEIPFFFFLLQSGEYTRAQLNKESYEFIKNMLVTFNTVDPKQIEEFKKGIIAQLLEDPKTFEDANNRLWFRAFKLTEQFDYHLKEAKEVENLTKEKITSILEKAFKKEDDGIFFAFQIQGTFDTTKEIQGFTPIANIHEFKTTYGNILK